MFVDFSNGKKDDITLAADVYTADNIESLWLSVSEKQL
jgi:hypothetical protein